MKKLSIIFSTILLVLVLSSCVYDDRDYCSDARLAITNETNSEVYINLGSSYCNIGLYPGETYEFDLGSMNLDDYNTPYSTIYVRYSYSSGSYDVYKNMTQTTCYKQVGIDSYGPYDIN